MQGITVRQIKKAVEKGGSARAAAKLLGKPYTSLQWWLLRNGYRIEKRAELVKVQDERKQA